MTKILLYQIDYLFLKKRRGGTQYKKPTSYARRMYINAHFPRKYKAEHLTLDEKFKLVEMLQNQISGGNCCDLHNQHDKEWARERQITMKASYFRNLRERMAQGLEKCAWCFSVQDLTIDHILPIAKGGKSTPENTQILCRKCNNEKADLLF